MGWEQKEMFPRKGFSGKGGDRTNWVGKGNARGLRECRGVLGKGENIPGCMEEISLVEYFPPVFLIGINLREDITYSILSSLHIPMRKVGGLNRKKRDCPSAKPGASS